MKLPTVLLNLLFAIAQIQAQSLDVLQDTLYTLAELFESYDVDKLRTTSQEILKYEQRLAMHAQLREAQLRINAPWIPYLKKYDTTSEFYRTVRSHCYFQEDLICGYGIFLYAQAARSESLELFLACHNVDPLNYATPEALRKKTGELLAIEQLKLFSEIGKKGVDVRFGPDYLVAWAAWCGSLELVLLLVARRANVSRFGYYAIEAAVTFLDGIPENMRKERFKIIRYLIDKGAQVSGTAWELARKNCAKGDKIITLLQEHLSVQSACTVM